MEEQGTLVRVAVLLAVRLRVVLEEQARLGEVEVEVVRVPVEKRVEEDLATVDDLFSKCPNILPLDFEQ
jgi:hypothetical protein